MKTSLELINMSKATSEQQQNSPLEITHLPRAHRCLFHPLPYSHLQALQCLLLADIFPEGNSTKIPSSASTYNCSHSSSGFQGDPCWLTTVEHSCVRTLWQILHYRPNQDFRKEIPVGGMLFKIFQPSFFRNLPNLSPGRHWLLGRDFFLSEKTHSSELSLI